MIDSKLAGMRESLGKPLLIILWKCHLIVYSVRKSKLDQEERKRWKLERKNLSEHFTILVMVTQKELQWTKKIKRREIREE